MAKKQKKMNTTKKALLGTLIPVFAIATATSIAVPLVLFNNKETPIPAADKEMVTKINDLIEGETFTSMSSLITYLKDEGIELQNLVPETTDAQYVWDQENNIVFLMNKDGSVVCPQGFSPTQNQPSLWRMVSSSASTNLLANKTNSVYVDEFKSDATYSQFLRDGSTFTGNALQFSSGIDTGNNTNLVLTLVKNESLTEQTQPITITTNGCSLNVNSTSFKDIKHEGTLLDLNLNTLQSEGTFSTSGKIVGDVVIASGVDGTFVAEAEAEVNTIFVADPDTTIEVKSDSVGTIVPTTEEAAEAIDDIVEISEEVTEEPEIVEEKQEEPAETELSGIGTERSPFIVTSKADFAKIHEYSTYGYKYFIFENTNKTIDGSNWEINDFYGDLNGSFDGNGLIINNLSRPLFKTVGTSEGTTSDQPYAIKNITLNCDICLEESTAAVVRNLSNYAVFENVNVHGYISGTTNVGGFVALGTGNIDAGYVPHEAHWQFTNCHSDATIISTQDWAAGFIGFNFNAFATSDYIFDDSYFDGTIINTSEWSGTQSHKNYAYFSGGTYWDSMKIKTTYSDEFIAEHGNPENVYYNAPRLKDDGWFYVGNRAPSGKEDFNVYEGYIKEDKRSLLTKVELAEPQTKAQTISVAKQADVTSATASLFIGPNDTTGHGNYVANFLSEELNVSNDTLTTSIVKNYNIRVNEPGITEQGVHGDYYDVYDAGSFYGTSYGGCYILIIQYKLVDGVNVPVHVTKVDMPHN